MRIDQQIEKTDWQGLLDQICEDITPYLGKGKVADYIPALACADPCAFGMAFTTVNGDTFRGGQADDGFSIQSISKVFALILALEQEGDDLWTRVGREPSGSAFNSIVQLEEEKGRPRNPFINAGALVVTDSIVSHCGHQTAIDMIVDFLRQRSGNNAIDVNMEVAMSEEEYGDRNRSLAYFMKSFGVLRHVEETTATYFRQCAIEMSAADLSRAGLFLATDG
ncbi:MAG: glutaminase, partial [Pseudomonadota bacterium]